jgi:hypothetical protein
MRLVVALSVMIISLLSVECYLRFSGARDVVAPTQYVQPDAAPGKYSLELTLSFDATADEFSFSFAEPDDQQPSESQVSLLVKLDGQELTRLEETVPADSPVVIQDIPVHEGTNEFFLEIAPNADAPGAVRLQIKRDDQVVGQQVFWAEAGEPLADTWSLTVSPEPDSPKHDHD